MDTNTTSNFENSDAVENSAQPPQTQGTESAGTFARTSSPMVTLLIATNVAVGLLLPIAFASWFPYRRVDLGALWGPLVFSGQWWRVLTYSFVHFELLHLTFNMLGLWILGTRVEREFGRWVFLYFYLACGTAAALVMLALHPFTAFDGASGAIVGLAGGAIAIYAPRFSSLSWGSRAKLGALFLYAAGLIGTEYRRVGQFFPHTVGLTAGVLLASFFVYIAKTTRSRYWTFGVLASLIVIAAIFIQGHHRWTE